MTKEDFCLDKFITHILALMGDLSKNFSRLEIMCPCGCGANKISSILIEKLQKVRNIIGTSIIITSGVRCEFYNTSIKASMNSSHIPDSYGMGNAVDIACTNSKDRYELVELSQKFFNRIGISGGSYGGFVHLDVDRSKVQEVMWIY